MPSSSWKSIVYELRSKLDEIEGGLSSKKYRLSLFLHEDWYSDSLAWILDPRGSHGLGVEPLKEVVKLIAQKRSDQSLDFERRASFLKFGKEGYGVAASGLSLKNASTVRDFHLTRSLGAFPDMGTRFCDLLVMDFDSPDSLIILIENKFVGQNRRNQLEDYFLSAEAKFKQRVKCREYLYLTLKGDRPKDFHGENISNWVCLGWIPDILLLLDGFDQKDSNRRIDELKQVLTRIEALLDHIVDQQIKELRRVTLIASAECLIEELNRLTGPGEWNLVRTPRRNSKSVRVKHSSHPARAIILRVRSSGPSIEVRGILNRKRLFETMILPCNVHPTQSQNLLDLSAAEIMRLFFESPQSFKNNKHWKKDKNIGKKLKYRPLFELMNDFPHAVDLLFSTI